MKPLANIGTKLADLINENAYGQERSAAAKGVSDRGVRRGVPGVGYKCCAVTPHDRGVGKSSAAPIGWGYKSVNESVTGAGPGPVQFGGGVPRIFVVDGGKPRLESVRKDITRKPGSQSAIEALGPLSPFGRIVAPLIPGGSDGGQQEEAGLRIGLQINTEPFSKCELVIGPGAFDRRWWQ